MLEIQRLFILNPFGEVRDGSALDLLKAWNTGHSGGLCTLHANDTAGALLRLEELVREGTDHPPKSLISRTVNLILHIERDSSHQRRVTAMATLCPAPDGAGPGTRSLRPEPRRVLRSMTMMPVI